MSDTLKRVTLNSQIHSRQDVQQKFAEFQINSDQICEDWLKNRKKKPFSNEEIQHYQQIVAILKDMVKLVEEIKAFIQLKQLEKLELFEQVRAIAVTKLGVEFGQVTPSTCLIDDLGADSLEIMELFSTLEEKFNIKIPKETTLLISTVQQIINFIHSNVRQTAVLQE